MLAEHEYGYSRIKGERTMKYLEKRATLSDGTIVILRSPTAEDAENALKYLEIIDTETDFLTMEPGERKLTVEEVDSYVG